MVNSGFTYREINYGGVNKMFLWLGNTLAEENYDVTFCCIHDKKRSERISINAKSIELALPAHASFLKKHFSFFYHATKKLNHVIKKEQYDYVINFDGMAFYVLLFLKLFNSYTFIVSERADPYYNQSVWAKLKRWLYRYVDILVCQTEGAKKFFSIKTQRKSVVIPNPIIIPHDKWKLENSKHQVAHVARLHIWQKRQDVLLKAFAFFVKNHQDYILNIYGGGMDEKTLKKLAITLGVDKSVKFHGNTSNVQFELLSNEIFVLSSDFEGMPNALMEAMALGMPVVSTKCSPGGAEALIENGYNGLLTACGDPEAIANALSQYVDNHQKEKEIANNARKSMTKFEQKIILNLWKKIVS